MKAPEKIYLEAIYPDNGVLPNGLNYTPSPTDIEYTRTDVFIEKAVNFLSKEENLPLWSANNGRWGCHTSILIKDFVDYMKG